MDEKQEARDHYEHKEMLSVARDLILRVRDSLPIYSEKESSTPNQRRALRTAILKLLKVWQDLYHHSNVKEPERTKRINVIEQMRIDALAIVLAHNASVANHQTANVAQGAPFDESFPDSEV